MDDTALTELLTAVLDDNINVCISRIGDEFWFRFTKNGWSGYCTVPIYKLGSEEFDDLVRARVRMQIYRLLQFIEDEEE